MIVPGAIQKPKTPLNGVGGAVGAMQKAKAAAPAATSQQQPAYTPGTFSYDPNSDPVYQAALARAKTNAQSASGDAMASLNKRGILDSTITGDRVAGIQQDAVSGVETDLMPQLLSQAYQRFGDSENRKYQMSRDAVSDKQQAFNNDITKADTFGYYLPSGAEDIENQLVNIKLQAQAKGATPQQKAQWSAKADELRAQLGDMGVDPSLFGSNVDAATARANIAKSGQQTYAAGRDAIADARYTDETAYGRGRDVIGDQRYTDETAYNHGRDKVADQRYTDETAYNHTRDKRADFVDDRNYGRGVYESDRGFNQSASNTSTDNARAADNAAYGRLMDIWQATGKAPQGMQKYGVQPGTPYGQQKTSSGGGDNQIDQDYKDDYSSFVSNPSEAYSWISDPANAKSVIDKYGTSKYQELMKLVTPKK